MAEGKKKNPGSGLGQTFLSWLHSISPRAFDVLSSWILSRANLIRDAFSSTRKPEDPSGAPNTGQESVPMPSGPPSWTAEQAAPEDAFTERESRLVKASVPLLNRPVWFTERILKMLGPSASGDLAAGLGLLKDYGDPSRMLDQFLAEFEGDPWDEERLVDYIRDTLRAAPPPSPTPVQRLATVLLAVPREVREEVVRAVLTRFLPGVREQIVAQMALRRPSYNGVCDFLEFARGTLREPNPLRGHPFFRALLQRELSRYPIPKLVRLAERFLNQELEVAIFREMARRAPLRMCDLLMKYAESKWEPCYCSGKAWVVVVKGLPLPIQEKFPADMKERLETVRLPAHREDAILEEACQVLRLGLEVTENAAAADASPSGKTCRCCQKAISCDCDAPVCHHCGASFHTCV